MRTVRGAWDGLCGVVRSGSTSAYAVSRLETAACCLQHAAAFEVLRGGAISVGMCWTFMAQHSFLQRCIVQLWVDATWGLWYCMQSSSWVRGQNTSPFAEGVAFAVRAMVSSFHAIRCLQPPHQCIGFCIGLPLLSCLPHMLIVTMCTRGTRCLSAQQHAHATLHMCASWTLPMTSSQRNSVAAHVHDATLKKLLCLLECLLPSAAPR